MEYFWISIPMICVALFFYKKGKINSLDLRSPSIGTNKCPVGMFQGQMSSELLKHLQETPIFNTDENELEKIGFARCVDYKRVWDHIYYEGYFHSTKDFSCLSTINPRNGQTFEKPPAPKPLRAFFMAFRKINSAVFLHISEEILAYSQKCKPFADMFVSEDLMGDLAIQVHYGDEIKEENLGWHVDNINSAFHLALTIGGTRSLHYQLSPQVPDGWGARHEDIWFRPGDFYCSSPAFFRHAVEFPQSDWKHRSISIQSRFLLTKDKHFELNSIRNSGDIQKVCEIIANHLCGGVIKIPTLQDVLEIEKELEEYNGPFPIFLSEAAGDYF